MPNIQIPPDLVSVVMASTPSLVSQQLSGSSISPVVLRGLEVKFNNLLESMLESKIEELKDERLIDAIQDKNQDQTESVASELSAIANEAQDELGELFKTNRDQIVDHAVEIEALSQQEFNNLVSLLLNTETRPVEQRLEAEIGEQQIQLDNFQSRLAEISTQFEIGEAAQVASSIEEARLKLASDGAMVSDFSERISSKEAELSSVREDRSVSALDRLASSQRIRDELAQLNFESNLAMVLAEKQRNELIASISTTMETLSMNREGSTLTQDGEAAPAALEWKKFKGSTSRNNPWNDLQYASPVEMESLEMEIESHMDLRTKNVLNVLDTIFDLKELGLLKKGTTVTIEGAEFQLLAGTRVENSAAAHQLPGQVYLGASADELKKMSDLEQAKYRFDVLAEDLADLKGVDKDFLSKLHQGRFGTTTVLPDYVNQVDSQWERRGLVDAFQKSIKTVLDSDLEKAKTLEQAYLQFKDDALKALNRAQNRIDELERANQANNANRALSEKYASMQEVGASYTKYLLELDYEKARIGAGITYG